MILAIKELCAVDYINEDDVEDEGVEYCGIRTILYESEKDKFFEALKDYVEDFNFDKMISSEDDFEGSCLHTIDIISAVDFEKMTDSEDDFEGSCLYTVDTVSAEGQE